MSTPKQFCEDFIDAMNSRNEPPCEVPLVEQLRSVPANARQVIEACTGGSRSIPYGSMCHRAADDLTALRARLETFERIGQVSGMSAGEMVLALEKRAEQAERKRDEARAELASLHRTFAGNVHLENKQLRADNAALRAAGNNLAAEFCQWCPHEHRRPFLEAWDRAALAGGKEATT